MFSVRQKRKIAEAVQKILHATKHPELPTGEIRFLLHVDGAEPWSFADIHNNGAVTTPGVNPWNELQDSPQSVCKRRNKREQRQMKRIGLAAVFVAAIGAVAVIKADSTVAILDGGGNNIGNIELSSFDFSLCEHQGYGTTVHRKVNHPWFWDCSNGYHLTE